MINTEGEQALSTTPDLTALIDIVFIVVVFLLLTANSRLLTMDIDLPTSRGSTEQQAAPAALVIALQQQSPRWQIEGDQSQSFDHWQQLEQALRQKLQTEPGREQLPAVHVAAAQQLPVDRLLQLLELLNELGASNTEILMRGNTP